MSATVDRLLNRHYGNWQTTIILAAGQLENPAILLMPNRGKLVVLSIFAVALAMASFALWWNWGMGRRSLAFWGKEGGLAIRDADRIELLRLRPKKGRLINLEGFDVVEKKDVSKAPGVVHARHSLLEDASFDWNANLGALHEWSNRDFFAVRFSHQNAVTTVVFIDLSFERIVHAESGDELALSPKTRDGWRLFISRFFPEDTPKSSTTPPSKTK